MATFRTDKGRPDIAFSGQYTIRPWTIANIGRLNNGTNVTPAFNYTYTIVQIMNTFEFTVYGVRYSVNDDNTTVTVAGYPSDSKPTGNLTIPKSVTYGGISYPVTSIGNEAFDGCSGLTSVTIGNSVTSIGKGAFCQCSGLTSVTIGNSVTSIGNFAFYKCSGLTSVTIPNSVTSIGNKAFCECSGLTSVTIPNSVTSIGDYAFLGCSGLTSIKVDSGNSVYDSRGNCNAIIKTATNTLISGCKNTIIPNSVTSIGDMAFDGCRGLTSVNIPNSVTSIGHMAFCDCSDLTSVIWNAKNCNAYYPLFIGCTNIKTFEFASEVERIPAYLCYDLTGLTSVIIPNSVTSIGDEAFENCSGLTSVTIPNSVTSIGDYAFNGCSGLTSVNIPNSVTSIGWGAFEACI